MVKTKVHSRSVVRRRSKTKKRTAITSANTQEADGTYIFKLVLYLIIGSLWLKITVNGDTQIPLPVGFLIGMLFAGKDHFQLDRKIEYAVLLVAMLLGFWLPIGVYISL